LCAPSTAKFIITISPEPFDLLNEQKAAFKVARKNRAWVVRGETAIGLQRLADGDDRFG